MIEHLDLATSRFGRLRKLQLLTKHGEIKFAGNRKLKIYGKLTCGSGKRMLDKNRVFFSSEQEADEHGYRPCGHCMREKYLLKKII